MTLVGNGYGGVFSDFFPPFSLLSLGGGGAYLIILTCYLEKFYLILIL
jgi:hypothetical protein